MATGLLAGADTSMLQLVKAPKQRTTEYIPQLVSSSFHSNFGSPCSSSFCRSSRHRLPYPSQSSLHLNDRGRRATRPCYVVACLSSSSSRSTYSASAKLYVSGLSFRTTEESLRNAFEQFGQLVEVNLVMDKIANRPRGFAFLRYGTEEESKKAIKGMHGKFLDGRVIFVEVAKPRTEVSKNKQNPR